MKNSDAMEKDAAKKPKRIIWVVLTALFLIGAYSALLIPALDGQSIQTVSIFSVVFWSGILFMTIWRYRSKSLGVGLIVGLIAGFVLLWGSLNLIGPVEISSVGSANAASKQSDAALRDSCVGVADMAVSGYDAKERGVQYWQFEEVIETKMADKFERKHVDDVLIIMQLVFDLPEGLDHKDVREATFEDCLEKYSPDL